MSTQQHIELIRDALDDIEGLPPVSPVLDRAVTSVASRYNERDRDIADSLRQQATSAGYPATRIEQVISNSGLLLDADPELETFDPGDVEEPQGNDSLQAQVSALADAVTRVTSTVNSLVYTAEHRLGVTIPRH